MGLRQLIAGARVARKMRNGDHEGAMKLAVQAGLLGGEIDPNDPGFEPVQGVDVDRYAHICKKIVAANQQKKLDQAGLDALLTGEGVDPAHWAEIANVWNERVMKNRSVKMRYSEIFIES